MARAAEVLEKNKLDILLKKNVQGVAHGYDVDKGNVKDDEEIIVAYVQKKEPLEKLDPADVIPIKIDGIKTRVREIGPIYALNEYPPSPTKHYRPVYGGMSVGYKSLTTGTVGVAFDYEGQRYILSNNHVIGNTNDYNAGDVIISPSQRDGGKMFHGFSELVKVEDIKFRSSPFKPMQNVFSRIWEFFVNLFGKNGERKKKKFQEKVPPNYVDVAIAKADNKNDVSTEIIDIGKINGIREPELGMKVRKYGRSSRYTEGKIVQLGASLEVEFSFGRKALFDQQIVVTGMSDKGDSGSVLVDEENYIVGLIFSGNEDYTVANDINKVFEVIGMDPEFN